MERKYQFSKVSLKWAALLWIVSTYFLAFSVFAIDSPVSAGLVFCPLQKQWVEKSLPKPVRTISSLSDICAGNDEKSSFVDRVGISPLAREAANDALETVFFGYTAKGSRIFSELPSAPNSPDSPLAADAKNELNSSGVRVDPAVGDAQRFSLYRLSRPATKMAAAKFRYPQFRDLEYLSHAIKPRAPPVSL